MSDTRKLHVRSHEHDFDHDREHEHEDWEESPRKRIRSAPPEKLTHPSHDHWLGQSAAIKEGLIDHSHVSEQSKDKSITIASTARLAAQNVAPFLARHIPDQYAPLSKITSAENALERPSTSNSKFCYRHRPDMLCRRQADEPSMEKLQKGLETLSEDDRRGIVQVWSLFSAAPSKHRELMLQGILAQCCFPQLSYLSANIRELIRIDFISALPSEVSFRILSFLDTTSLCKAAQVSRRWRQLADDDVVWHRMCEQHIDRKCTKCGWGLPLLERKRLRETKRQIQLRATGQSSNSVTAAETVSGTGTGNGTTPPDDGHTFSDIERLSNGRLSPVANRRPQLGTSQSDLFPKTRPWKDIYKDRFKVGSNWKYGRCSISILKGHSNGIMALQFVDNILATGSYDATIKIWDLDTGKELRTLTGHTMGVRCLQFDATKLISGSLDNTLKIWNWRTGECISTYHGHSEGVISLHFDSNLMVSGSIDKTVRVWNFKDRSVFTLRGHTDWVNSVKIDSASRTLFTASDDCTVKLWDLDTKKCIRVYEGHVGQVQQVLPLPPEFDVEEEGDSDDHISDPPTPLSTSGHIEPLSNVFGYQPSISPVQSSASLPEFFSSQPNRPQPPKYILTSALDSTIRLWEVSTGRCIKTYFGHVEGVWAIAADTLRIVSGAEDRTVKVWDPRSGKSDKTFAGHAGPVTCIGLSDSRMCSGGEDGEVRVYNFTS